MRQAEGGADQGRREAAIEVAEGRAEWRSSSSASDGGQVASSSPPVAAGAEILRLCRGNPRDSTDPAAARAFIAALTSAAMASAGHQRLRAAEVTAFRDSTPKMRTLRRPEPAAHSFTLHNLNFGARLAAFVVARQAGLHSSGRTA